MLSLPAYFRTIGQGCIPLDATIWISRANYDAVCRSILSQELVRQLLKGTALLAIPCPECVKTERTCHFAPPPFTSCGEF